MLKKMMAALFGALVLVTPAAAAERTDCQGEGLTKFVEKLQAAGGKVEPMSEADTARIKEVKPPPNEPPFTFSMATNPSGDTQAMIVHDGECLLNMLGPFPKEAFDKLLQKVDA